MNLPIDQSLINKRTDTQETSSITDKYTSGIYKNQNSFQLYSDSNDLLFTDTQQHALKINTSAYETLFVDKQEYPPLVSNGYEGMLGSFLTFILICQIFIVVYLIIKIISQKIKLQRKEISKI